MCEVSQMAGVALQECRPLQAFRQNHFRAGRTIWNTVKDHSVVPKQDHSRKILFSIRHVITTHKRVRLDEQTRFSNDRICSASAFASTSVLHQDEQPARRRKLRPQTPEPDPCRDHDAWEPSWDPEISAANPLRAGYLPLACVYVVIHLTVFLRL